MRAIKFRGRDSETGAWAYGHYYEQAAPLECCGEQQQGKHFIVFPGLADWGMPRRMLQVEVDPQTVGPCVGLRDCNGKEIYEGDVLLDAPGLLFQVVWDANWARFKLVPLQHISYPEWNRGIWMRIVGNIYENPELVQGANE